MKKLLLALLLPVSFSLHAVSPLSIAKLGGAAVAGVISYQTGKFAVDAHGSSKGASRPMGDAFAIPFVIASVSTGILAAVAVNSALEIDMDFALRSVKIK